MAMALPRPALSPLPRAWPVVAGLAVVMGACGGLFPEPRPEAGGSGAAAAALESLDAAGRQALDAYAVAAPNKAFAMSGTGAWGWQAGTGSFTAAQNGALERCESVSAGGEPCRIVVWDAGADLGDPSLAASLPGGGPVLDDPGVTAFQTFLAADGNKAFAVSPDGAWGWRASGALPLEVVQAEARANCARHGQDCDVVVTAPDVEAIAAAPR